MENVAIVGSITHMPTNRTGLHVCAGSHGGAQVAAHALKCGVASLIVHDAGIGLDAAGIAAVDILQQHGVPCVTVDCRSARIGDEDDMLARGKISHVNLIAETLGVRRGDAAKEALETFVHAESSVKQVEAEKLPELSFRRDVIHSNSPSGRFVITLDSASSVRVEDEKHIVVTGSHGGLPGADPSNAIKAPVYFIAFNDAGVGVDEAGTSRVPVLDQMHIASVTVDAMTAHIGSGRSTYETGIISCVNLVAKNQGAEIGMPLRIHIDNLLMN